MPKTLQRSLKLLRQSGGNCWEKKDVVALQEVKYINEKKQDFKRRRIHVQDVLER